MPILVGMDHASDHGDELVPPDVELPVLDGELQRGSDIDAWTWCVEYVRRHVKCVDRSEGVSAASIKDCDPDTGADVAQLARVLLALDSGAPVAFRGWWPSPAVATVTTTLGVDVLDVPTPDRKGEALVDGHSVVLVGYARHHAFAGGGYFVIEEPQTAHAETTAVRYLPFTFVRAYATELMTAVAADGRGDTDEQGGSSDAAPTIGSEADEIIARRARCADPRANYTALFFSEAALDTLRAKAICSVCVVRKLCLQRAIERREPYGVWGGEFLVDGEVVTVKRGRGRPPRIPLPDLVDEITGEPRRVA